MRKQLTNHKTPSYLPEKDERSSKTAYSKDKYKHFPKNCALDDLEFEDLTQGMERSSRAFEQLMDRYY